MKTKMLVRVAVIAALYATLTLVAAPISYGPVQFRISEILCVLPLIYPEAAIGLTIGCLIANFFGNGWLDIVFGTLATLIASLLMLALSKIKKDPLRVILGILPHIIINAIVVPFTFLALTELKEAYFINLGTVALGQAVVLFVGGIPFYYLIKRLKNKYEFLE